MVSSSAMVPPASHVASVITLGASKQVHPSTAVVRTRRALRCPQTFDNGPTLFVKVVQSAVSLIANWIIPRIGALCALNVCESWTWPTLGPQAHIMCTNRNSRPYDGLRKVLVYLFLHGALWRNHLVALKSHLPGPKSITVYARVKLRIPGRILGRFDSFGVPPLSSLPGT